MESVAELLKWVLENLNYWVVTIFMAIESSFIPFPSEAIVPPAAWKAMADDSMNIFLVILFATIGADIGALVNYYLARWLGRPIIYKFANSRLGHMCLIDEEKIHHAGEIFQKARCSFHFLWPPHSGCTPTYQYSRRISRHENRFFPALYNSRRCYMEQYISFARIPDLPFYRPQND